MLESWNWCQNVAKWTSFLVVKYKWGLVWKKMPKRRCQVSRKSETCIRSVAFVHSAKKQVIWTWNIFYRKDESISIWITYKWKWKMKESRGENNVTEKLFWMSRGECRLRRTWPSSWLRKSLLFEISSAVSFHGGELKLVPKYRQINKLSCGIKIIGS